MPFYTFQTISFSKIFFSCYSVLSSFSNSHVWYFAIISCRPRCGLCCLQHCWLAVRPLPDAEGEWDLCLSMLARGKELFDLLHNTPGQRLKFCEMFPMCLLENTSTLICTELWSGVSGVSFRNPLWNVPVLGPIQGAEEGCFVPTSDNVLLNILARCTHYKRSGKSTLMRVWGFIRLIRCSVQVLFDDYVLPHRRWVVCLACHQRRWCYALCCRPGLATKARSPAGCTSLQSSERRSRARQPFGPGSGNSFRHLKCELTFYNFSSTLASSHSK